MSNIDKKDKEISRIYTSFSNCNIDQKLFV